MPLDLTGWKCVERLRRCGGCRIQQHNWVGQIDASLNGTLVYHGDPAGGLVTLQWLDAAGKTQRFPAKAGVYGQPVVHPTAPQLVLNITTAGGHRYLGLRLATRRDVEADVWWGTFGFPVWHPDGRLIVFTGGLGVGGMFWSRADGASKPQPLTQSKFRQFPWSFSPDGKRLAFGFPGTARGRHLDRAC